jgi:hypothetical protein
MPPRAAAKAAVAKVEKKGTLDLSLIVREMAF